MNSITYFLVLILLSSIALAGSNKGVRHPIVNPPPEINYEDAGKTALQQFNIASVRYALAYLASDSLQGRETTEIGQKKSGGLHCRTIQRNGHQTARG